MIEYKLTFRTALLPVVFTLLSACSNNPQPDTANTPPSAPPPTAAAPATYEGYHDITNCIGVMGWALDMSRPEEPIKVDIYDGDKLLATVSADQFRQDLLDHKKGNGKHSFIYPFPSQLKDGKPHVLRMKFAGTITDLKDTSKEITCTSE